MNAPENKHIVDSSWRLADIEAKAARVLGLMAWLDHTMDLVEMLEDDEQLATELRGVAAGIRTKRNDISSEINLLQGKLEEQSPES